MAFWVRADCHANAEMFRRTFTNSNMLGVSVFSSMPKINENIKSYRTPRYRTAFEWIRGAQVARKYYTHIDFCADTTILYCIRLLYRSMASLTTQCFHVYAYGVYLSLMWNENPNDFRFSAVHFLLRRVFPIIYIRITCIWMGRANAQSESQ